MRLLGLLLCFLTTSCNWVYKTVSIELPEHYQGWILVIPAPDSLTASVNMKADRYLVSAEGICYVPALEMRGVDRYRIYLNGEDVEPQTQYSGLTQQQVKGGDRVYIQFYLPPTKTRSITSREYWLQQIALIEEQKREKMKRLEKSGKLAFLYKFPKGLPKRNY